MGNSAQWLRWWVSCKWTTVLGIGGKRTSISGLLRSKCCMSKISRTKYSIRSGRRVRKTIMSISWGILLAYLLTMEKKWWLFSNSTLINLIFLKLLRIWIKEKISNELRGIATRWVRLSSMRRLLNIEKHQEIHRLLEKNLSMVILRDFMATHFTIRTRKPNRVISWRTKSSSKIKVRKRKNSNSRNRREARTITISLSMKMWLWIMDSLNLKKSK